MLYLPKYLEWKLEQTAGMPWQWDRRVWWHRYPIEMCDCWNVWCLWSPYLKYKVFFLKPSTSIVQKWLTALKPKPQSFCPASFFILGVDLRQNLSKAMVWHWGVMSDEFVWIQRFPSRPLLALFLLLLLRAPQVEILKQENFLQARDFLLPLLCHCLGWTILVRFNWISHLQ